MKKALNFFRGSVRIEVECPYPERFVNICAGNDIEFWDLERISGTVLRVTVHIGGYRRLAALSRRSEFTVRPVKKAGVPYFLWHMRKRYVLVGGAVLCLLAVWVMSFFIWEIDVSGNETVEESEILAVLDELGVGIGTLGLSVDSEELSNKVLQELPELAWFAVNVRGSHAQVLVRERIPAPEIIDESHPMMVYAEKSGLVTKINALEGDTLCAVGDTVLQGDILISGIMSSETADTRFVHALGEVYARTWYERSACMPLTTVVKDYTGEVETKRAIIIAGKRINLYFNSSILWPGYDKITYEKNLRLPTGNVLPITFVRETYSAYDAVEIELTVEEAEEVLQERLTAELAEEIGSGEILKTDFETAVENGTVTVTMRAECEEQIAAQRDFTADEMIIEKTEETETEDE
jgi:similar to stage IV sporulation protein